MINTCARCGAYRADKAVDPRGPFAVCPECGHAEPFAMLPLLAIGGASGAGKSTAGRLLCGRIPGAVLLESDLLWREGYHPPDDDYRDFFETWLRMAKNISQSGRPVVVLGAGFAVPRNLERCVERRYIATISYLALVCEDTELKRRLRSRPAWRGSNDPAFVERNADFNRWLLENAKTHDPPIDLIDTTDVSPAQTVEQMEHWIAGKLAGRGAG
jgi:2-phosphoglycerate kinase